MNIRTDLAIEEIANSNDIKGEVFNYHNCEVTKVVLDEVQAKKIGKKAGSYYTIDTSKIDTNEFDLETEVSKTIKKVLTELINKIELMPLDKILVVGLGNNDITPDALGPKVIDNLIVTSHLYKLGELDERFKIVSAITPGVMGQTGIETSDIISSIVKKEKPKLVIAIDALASRSLKRVCNSIQITDSGINPGSGVGNTRKELSLKTLKTNVIAIGVPTVVDITNISNDIFDILDDKEKLKEEFLYKKDEYSHLNFMVTPKGIDQEIDNLASIISKAINYTLHKI